MGHAKGGLVLLHGSRFFHLKNKAVRKTTAIISALLWGQLLFAQFSTDTIMTHADQMPFFIGCHDFDDDLEAKRKCSDREMVRFISRYLVYPEVAKMSGIEGTVYVSFVVNEEGLVQQPNLLTDIGGGCGQAALDVLKEMPRWEPALHAGQRAKVRLNLPIQFFLRAEERDLAERFNLTWGSLKGETTTREELVNALNRSIYVRGPEGDSRFVDELEFVFEKKGRIVTGTGRGNISTELEKVVERTKRGGVFTIRASVQDEGQFVSVVRAFRVVE